MADKSTELERVYTIPLRKTKDLVRSRRADLAVRDVKRFLTRHMKAESVWLDNTVNEALWSQGKFTIPSRIRVRATRFSDGVVEVTLPESTQTGSVREAQAERRAKAAEAPVLKGPSAEEGEEGEGGSAARPVTDVKGVGPATAEKLEKAGIATLDELAAADPAKVAEVTAHSVDKAKSWIHDAKDILAGKTEVADVKAQPALEADPEKAEAKDEAKTEKAEGKAEKADKPAAKKAKKDDE